MYVAIYYSILAIGINALLAEMRPPRLIMTGVCSRRGSLNSNTFSFAHQTVHGVKG